MFSPLAPVYVKVTEQVTVASQAALLLLAAMLLLTFAAYVNESAKPLDFVESSESPWQDSSFSSSLSP